MTFPPVLPQDKANHVVYGVLAAVLMLAVLKFTGLPAGWRMPAPNLVASIAGMAAGIGKELADWAVNRFIKPGSHTVDVWDMVATWMGGNLVSLAFLAAR